MINNDMLSAMARGTEGRELLDFAEANLPGDWQGEAELNVKVNMTGGVFGNFAGNLVCDPNSQNRLNQEYLLHLEGPNGACVANVATLFAMAAAYCREQGKLAKKATAALARRSRATAASPASSGRNKKRRR